MSKQASKKKQKNQKDRVMVVLSIKKGETGTYTFKKSILPKDEAVKLLESHRTKRT